MANEKIASGSVILSANADRLAPGLKKAEDQVQGWGSRVKGIFKAAFAGGLSGGAIGAAAIGGVRALTDGFRGLTDELENVSRAGAAAKAFGLTAEQFTGIAGVAQSVGEGQREFIESLVTLGKVASEGAAGKGEVAAAWFQSLNLNAQEFKSLRLDEQFFKVFEAIQKVEDPASRVRALMVAFGEDGGKYLLPLLSKTPGEIREMAKGFAVSAEQVEAATEANQSWIKANTEIKSAIREIAVDLAPAAKSFLDDFMTPAAKAAKDLAAGYNDAADALKRVRDEQRQVPGFANEFTKSLPTMNELIPSVAVSVYSLGDAFENAEKSIDDFAESWIGFRPNFTDPERIDNAGKFLDTLNNPPKSPIPEVPTGIVSGWAKWAREAEHAKDQAEKLDAIFGPNFGIGLLTTGIPAVDLFAKSLQAAFEPGKTFNPFREGGLANEIKKLEPKFAEALEAGSEEAYSLTLRNTFPIGSEDENPQKEANRKLDRIGGLLDDLTQFARDFSENVGAG